MILTLFLGVWITGRAQDAQAPVYGSIEAVDSAARRIRIDGQTYALAAGALIRWQSGQPADLPAVHPRMRVAIELVNATASDPVPQIRILTLRPD